MTHNNASREIGTRWEVQVRDHLQAAGFPAQRLGLAGRRDIGDLTGVPGFLIGCKAEKTIRLSTYMDELRAQRDNADRYSSALPTVPIEVVKRRGAGVGRAYVVVELDEFLPILRTGGQP